MQKTNIEVDKARLLRRAIVISWASLALCFVIKIFGGNFFEIICDNPNYKALCKYIDTHLWFKFIMGFMSSMVCQTLFLLSILQKYWFTKKEFVITTISVAISCALKLFELNFAFIADIWLSILLPLFFFGKNYKKYYLIIVANFLIVLFQFVSLFVRNLSIAIIDDNAFISLIYMIDLYLMCLLYYLYTNYKKENEKMGIYWVWFAGKPVDKLKAMKEKREAKIKKLEAEINAIEIEIEKQKKNDK